MRTHSRTRELAGAILCGVVAVVAIATSGRCDDKAKTSCPHCREGRGCEVAQKPTGAPEILSRIPYLNRLFKNVGSDADGDGTFERVGVDFDFVVDNQPQGIVVPRTTGVDFRIVGEKCDVGEAAPKFKFVFAPACPTASEPAAVTAQMPATAPICDRCPGCIADGACCEIELVSPEQIMQYCQVLKGNDIELIGVEPESPDLSLVIDGGRAMGRAEVLERLLEKLEEHHATTMELAVKNARLEATIEHLEQKAEYMQGMFQLAHENETLKEREAIRNEAKNGTSIANLGLTSASRIARAGDETATSRKATGKLATKSAKGGKAGKKAAGNVDADLAAQNRLLVSEIQRLRERVTELEQARATPEVASGRSTGRAGEVRR